MIVVPKYIVYLRDKSRVFDFYTKFFTQLAMKTVK